MKQQYKAFMGQFQAARKEVQSVPAWMRESARVATLTYPPTRTAGEAAQPASSVKKKA